MNSNEPTAPYLSKLRSGFQGLLQWQEFDAFWDQLRAQTLHRAPQDSGWFLYAIGQKPPQQHADVETFLRFLDESQALLHKEHEETYCGIVYVDQRDRPEMIKVYDPSNLGVSCGSSDNPPLPGWVLSKLPPIDLPTALHPPRNRQRWWQRILGTA
jgi:hypothetical protein